jgi:hypothetical protein
MDSIPKAVDTNLANKLDSSEALVAAATLIANHNKRTVPINPKPLPILLELQRVHT